MRPIFCSNFDFDARALDLERLFRQYGKVDRVDMKSGFAFIHMDDERDAGYAIQALDQTEFGRKGKRLRVEWTKNEQRHDKKEVSSRRSSNLKPSKTLFVINFPHDTNTRELESYFDPYGKIINVRIRKNFGFVQFESQADATKALNATNMSKMLGRIISVEYSARGDDNDRRNDSGLESRGRNRSPDRRRRSPSPYIRERGSPDYGTGSNPASYGRERGSPVYGHGSSRSPRRVERTSLDYGQSPSPRHRERVYLDYRDRTRSPRKVERTSLEYGQVQSPSPRHGERVSLDYRDRTRSPRKVERTSLEYGQIQSPSPRHRERISPANRDYSQSPRGCVVERNGNGYGHHSGLKDRASQDDVREAGELEESPVDYRSRSQTPP